MGIKHEDRMKFGNYFIYLAIIPLVSCVFFMFMWEPFIASLSSIVALGLVIAGVFYDLIEDLI